MYRLFYTMIGIIIVSIQMTIFLHIQGLSPDVVNGLFFVIYILIITNSSNLKRFCPRPPNNQNLRLLATAAFATAVSYSTSIMLVSIGFGTFENMIKICVIGIFVPIICFFYKLGDSKWVSYFFINFEKNFIFWIFSYNTLNYS